jgi:hypothetical protein
MVGSTPSSPTDRLSILSSLLMRRNRHAYPTRPAPAHFVQQRAVPAADIQYPGASPACNLVQEKTNLVVLRLLVREGGIAPVQTFRVVEYPGPLEYAIPEIVAIDGRLRSAGWGRLTHVRICSTKTL